MTHDEDALRILEQEFFNIYGNPSAKPSIYFAPGRVNIMGEHLDYNGGFVLPCALSIGVFLAVRKRNDKLVRMASASMHETFTGDLGKLPGRTSNFWWNYPLGVMHQMHIQESSAYGFEMLYHSNLPAGVGLSSSASIEVVTAFALNDLVEMGIPLLDLAVMSRRAENDFVGVQCGIMDPYAVAFGKMNQVIFLDTKSLTHELIPVQLGEYAFLISDTGIRRQLESSAFNDRFNECRAALKTLQRLLNVSEIADAVPEQFEAIEHWFPDERMRKRARHIVFENERVKKSATALRNGKLLELASLMNASHVSSCANFEVSCFELEAMAHASRFASGCLASRISGAGFGGCILSLVKHDCLNEIKLEIGREYLKSTGLTAHFYPVDIGNGVAKVSEPN